MNAKHDLTSALEAARGQRLDQATAIVRDILQRQPDQHQARMLLVQCLWQLGNSDGVRSELETLLRRARSDRSLIDQVAALMLRLGASLQPALLAYEAYRAKYPGSALAAFNHAWYQARDGQAEAAIESYLRAIDLGIERPEEAHLNIATVCMDQLRDSERARRHLQQALGAHPGYAAAWFNFGNLAEQSGDFEAARSHFARSLELEPGDLTALSRLADLHRFEEPGDPLLQRLAAAARNGRNADLSFALGRAYDQLGEYELAWRCFEAGNGRDRERLPPYDRTATEGRFRHIIAKCNRDWLARFEGRSHAPVFICGMFRSGSTLLEQILAAHARFVASGESEFFPRLLARELPDYPAGLSAISPELAGNWRRRHAEYAVKVAADGLRLTDKRPDNFLHAGLIKAVLPSAKIIVTDRDWRDTAVSIFATRLGAGQNYALRLEDIRHYIALQRELVDHWAELLGPDLIRVRYEELVEDPRKVVGNLLQALGEAWDEACLSFATVDSPVRTASSLQVREPLYARSVGRWRNYRPAFEAAFGPDFDP
jgi:tetratricopeptide (TPR) repeat protein